MCLCAHASTLVHTCSKVFTLEFSISVASSLSVRESVLFKKL